jgi:signal transduction histidine kinase/CheY-like chemotaxis protein
MHTRFATDEELAMLTAELGVRSAMAVPLKVHDRVLGVVTLVSAHREYRDQDLELAEDLAHRAASALDNARLYRAAQESDRRKEEFLAVLAHELRNPLAPIVTSLDILGVESRNPAAQNRARAVMERQVGNLSRLIDDLLDVSRITRGRIELDKQQVDLETIVANAVETARPLLEKGRIGLTLGIAPGVHFEADPLRLEQVLTNLLRNAAKYTPPGGEVEVRGTATRDEVTLSVRDTGVGIGPELLPHIFDPFIQGPSPTHGAIGGLGIGLTLVRGLIELHGGTVRASSAGSGKGSEFVIHLPIERILASKMAPSSLSSSTSGLRRRALVVDDNQDAANALGEILRLRGHEVRVVHDGKSALDLAASFRPDLVLLDIALPDIDGYQVATGIRSLIGLETIKIVAISGFGSEHIAKRYGSTIFNRHLVKPVDWSQLEPILAE